MVPFYYSDRESGGRALVVLNPVELENRHDYKV